jgi:chemotaxis protein histidine kinase CheA
MMKHGTPDGGFSIESLGEDTTENARHQLALLEKSLGSSPDPADAPALLDEAYRAAHSLKAAIDARRMPNVDRLARRVQDVVRATRAGSLAVTRDLSSVLSSIARIARDALDAVSEGKAEPLSASTAAATLEEMLAHPGTWSAPPALSAQPFVWAKVEAGRLGAAGDAAGDARSASAAYAHAAAATAALAEKLRSALDAHEEAVKRLREFIPGALATASRGESTTAVAAELAESLSAVSLNKADLDHSIAESATAVREAAILGSRAAERAETALSTLRSVRLDALLEQLSPIVRRGGRVTGREVEFTHEPTNVEIDAARADEVVSLLKSCFRALAGLPAARPRGGRRGAVIPARLSLSANAAGNDLSLRLALSGGAPGAERLKTALATVRKHVEGAGGRMESETRRGENASLLMTIRSAAVVTSRTAEFVFARAGDTCYALPASAVVECIEANMSIEDYEMDGMRLATLRMNDTRDPRQGVVVQTPRGGALLLFDAIGSREVALETTGGGDSWGMAGISGSVRRPDGTTARLVDLAVLLPEPAAEKTRAVTSGKSSGARPKR